MMKWQRIYKNTFKQLRFYSKSALVAVVIVALLFSSMGMQFSIFAPVIDTSISHDGMATMSRTSCMMTGMDCYSCSANMQMSGQMCSCPICNAIRNSTMSAMDMNSSAHSSDMNNTPIALCSISALPCSAPMQWMVEMVNLGWDIPPSVYNHTQLGILSFEPVHNTFISAQSSIAVESPPPC